MAPPLKYHDAAARTTGARESKRRYAQSERGKSTKSTQNRAAYKRRNGRRGSPVIPYINPVIPDLAREPVPITSALCLVFHTPKLVISAPLTREAILSLSDDLTQERSEIIHGLYLRYERDTQNDHIDRFNRGDIFYLQDDVERELKAALKKWKELWKREMTRWYTDDTETDGDHTVALVHLQWTSRIVTGLKEELFLLGTARRRGDYLSCIRARIVEIPNP